MELGSCRLCQERKELCRSHILPEFLHRPLYDASGKAIAFDPAHIDRTWKVQKGLREPLLCLSCEQLINDRYEKPFANFWKPGYLLRPLRASRETVLTHVPYAEVKLFSLSILWRADSATLPQFREVALGARHSEIIRKMLLSGDPGRPEEYQITCSAIESPDGLGLWGDGMIAPPARVRVGNHHAYLFTFGACAWMYFATSHACREAAPICLKDTGELPIVRLPWVGLRKDAPWARAD